MKITDNQKIIKLFEKEKFQEAVDCIEKLLVKFPSDEELLYMHAYIKTLYLEKYSNQTIDELTKVIDMDGKYKGKALTMLCIVYSKLDEPNEAYKAGTNPEIDYQSLKLEYYEAMGKTCFRLDGSHLEEGISYINKIIDFERKNDKTFNPYWHAIEASAYTENRQYDKAKSKIEEIRKRTGENEQYLILMAGVKLEMYCEYHNEKDLEEAIKLCEEAVKLEPLTYFAGNIYIRSLVYHHETDKAIEIVEKHKDMVEKMEYVNSLVTIYSICGDYEKIEEAALLLKDKFPEEEIYKWIAQQIFLYNKDIEALKQIKKYYLKAYNLSKEFKLLLCICNINQDLHQNEESLKLIDEFLAIATHNDVFFGHLLKAETMRKLNYDYDEIVEEYQISHFEKYLPKSRYLLSLNGIIKDPSTLYPLYKDFQKLPLSSIDATLYASLGQYYLYGENKFPVNYKKAKEFFFALYNLDKTSSNNVAFLGRYYEITNDEKNAFKCYKKAYELVKNGLPKSLCAYGFYAHACLKGIGTSKDEEFAKSIVLEAIEKYGKNSASTTLLQYAYFAVKGDSRFSLENAKEYLTQTSPFNRYNLSREVLIKQINDKLGIETPDYETKLANCLKYSPACDVEYYHNHKNDEAFYMCPAAL